MLLPIVLSLTVHPHTSGEYAFAVWQVVSGFGSSPHKWGILVNDPNATDDARFIPTQVGNTHGAMTEPRSGAVHPHTSGEYINHLILAYHPSGSSPHKWGILLMPASYNGSTRFIPTQVGNTSNLRRLRGRKSVHPHTSGEYSKASL